MIFVTLPFFKWLMLVIKWWLVCLFLWSLLSKELGIPIGILPMSGAGLDGNAPYQAQELQITTLANPGIQTNFLAPRPVQS